jgi:hypothetical protein
VLIMLAGPARFLEGQLKTDAIIKLFGLRERDLLGFPVGIRDMPIPSTPADLGALLRVMADGDGIPAADEPGTSPASAAALAQRINSYRVAPAQAHDPTGEHPQAACEVMARVLVREPGSPPFGTVLLGVPLWVTDIARRPRGFRR